MASFLRNTFDNLVNNINSTLSPNQNTPTPTRPTRPNRQRSSYPQPPNHTSHSREHPPSRGGASSRPTTNNSASDYIRIIRRNLAPFSGATNSRSNEQASRSSSQPPTGSRTQHRPHHGPSNCPRHQQQQPPQQHNHHQHSQHNQRASQQQRPQPQPQHHQQQPGSDNNNMSSNVNHNQTTNTAVKILKISEVRDPGDINNLTTKQLKTILTDNFVDYKGVFEKEVLREKVLQLWIDCNSKKTNNREGSQQNSGDIDESQACKICMEREINCVLLECGHMLTCVECGSKIKQKECPVCRQFVSRCVRTFRA